MNENDKCVKEEHVLIIVIVIMFIFVIIVHAFFEYNNDIQKAIETQQTQTRFVINDGNNLRNIENYSIMIDTENGVQYVVCEINNEHYMSVLMNPDGTPIVTVE